MTSVEMKTTINAPAGDVWQTVSDFNGLGKFVAAVADSSVDGSGVGSKRTLTLQDGARLVERLESLDDEARSLEYSIVSGPLPVENYLSRVQVKELGPGQCEVCWSSTFEPKGIQEKEAKEAIQGIYSMGFDGLKRLFG
ncbi:MAG: SRPBCC family protein [Thermodesulfobacteriota bacterium]